MEYDRLIELNDLVSRLPGNIPKFDENKIMEGRGKIVREAAKSHFNREMNINTFIGIPQPLKGSKEWFGILRVE
ncbi:MAG TPA: hypothetical protein ENG48_05045 [Candidatus Atribacteria bacterium]|nr:hypothetical protein [Candidatus Atribacteria bacterium]